MTIWFLLWLLLSVTLLYFLAWTLFILVKQKRAWKAYAEKHDLRYQSDALMQSPRLDGVLDGYTVSLFSAEHTRGDARRARKLTAIEVQLTSEMPFDGAIASEGMVDVVKSMTFKDEVKPDSKGWKSTLIAATDHKAAMQRYLTPKRLKALYALMKIKNAWVILAFRNDMVLLRIDTPYALENSDKVDELLNRMIKVAKALELDKGEGASLKTAKIKQQNQTLDDNTDADLGGLQLEDDETEAEVLEVEESFNEDEPKAESKDPS